MWQWTKSPKDSLVENFSRTNLERLAQHGLQPSSAGIFRQGRATSIVPSDCVCFPWFIVEHKKSNNKENQCYCQAANAGAAAVMMLQTLSQYATKKPRDEHVPPVVTMTTVNKMVRIWIIYSCNNSEAFVRIRIFFSSGKILC
jgi:hypothetical protein